MCLFSHIFIVSFLSSNGMYSACHWSSSAAGRWKFKTMCFLCKCFLWNMRICGTFELGLPFWGFPVFFVIFSIILQCYVVFSFNCQPLKQQRSEDPLPQGRDRPATTGRPTQHPLAPSPSRCPPGELFPRQSPSRSRPFCLPLAPCSMGRLLRATWQRWWAWGSGGWMAPRTVCIRLWKE